MSKLIPIICLNLCALNANSADLLDEGWPQPYSGVHIVPSAQMAHKEITKNLVKNATSMQDKGYIDKNNHNAVRLFSIKEISAKDLADHLDKDEPTSTHMKSSPAAVHAGYEYRGIPSAVVDFVIGYVPEGAYRDDLGWTGAVEFFEPKGLSETVCSYEQSNLKLTGGSANIAEEIVSYDVNKKVSVFEVVGNNATAFEYSMQWWDENFRHHLKCIQKQFNKSTVVTVKDIAVKIDDFVSLKA